MWFYSPDVNFYLNLQKILLLGQKHPSKYQWFPKTWSASHHHLTSQYTYLITLVILLWTNTIFFSFPEFWEATPPPKSCLLKCADNYAIQYYYIYCKITNCNKSFWLLWLEIRTKVKGYSNSWNNCLDYYPVNPRLPFLFYLYLYFSGSPGPP